VRQGSRNSQQVDRHVQMHMNKPGEPAKACKVKVATTFLSVY
jgi:hypothetical protein